MLGLSSWLSLHLWTKFTCSSTHCSRRTRKTWRMCLRQAGGVHKVKRNLHELISCPLAANTFWMLVARLMKPWKGRTWRTRRSRPNNARRSLLKRPSWVSTSLKQSYARSWWRRRSMKQTHFFQLRYILCPGEPPMIKPPMLKLLRTPCALSRVLMRYCWTAEKTEAKWRKQMCSTAWISISLAA